MRTSGSLKTLLINLTVLFVTAIPAWAAPVASSTFDTDRDNWSLTFGAAYGTALMWQPTGGNPGAGDCDV